MVRSLQTPTGGEVWRERACLPLAVGALRGDGFLENESRVGDAVLLLPRRGQVQTNAALWLSLQHCTQAGRSAGHLYLPQASSAFTGLGTAAARFFKNPLWN